MKSLLLAIAIATSMAATCSVASADESQRTLAPITVKHGIQQDCTPPSADAVCAPLHAQIRHVFSKREIGMLFGARTAFLEYPASYDSVHERYVAFMRDVELYGAQSVALVIR